MSHELDEPLIHSFGYEALPRCDCLTGPDMPGVLQQGDVLGTRFACAVLTQPAGLPCSKETACSMLTGSWNSLKLLCIIDSMSHVAGLREEWAVPPICMLSHLSLLQPARACSTSGRAGGAGKL